MPTYRTGAWIVGVALIAVGLIWYFAAQPANPFAVDPADHLSSWTIVPPIQDLASSTPRIEADMSTLRGMLASATSSKPDIYIGIGNDYVLLADGKNAYVSYGQALEASSTYTLAYANLGGLFARLHATSTALEAYAKAVALTPSNELFQLSYLNYLARIEPTASVTASAFSAAKQVFGPSEPNLLITEAEWLGAIGSTTAAIGDWEAVRAQVAPAQQAAIDAEIARLRAAH